MAGLGTEGGENTECKGEVVQATDSGVIYTENRHGCLRRSAWHIPCRDTTAVIITVATIVLLTTEVVTVMPGSRV